jgi:hypothetical protein
VPEEEVCQTCGDESFTENFITSSGRCPRCEELVDKCRLAKFEFWRKQIDAEGQLDTYTLAAGWFGGREADHATIWRLAQLAHDRAGPDCRDIPTLHLHGG